eukprot:TRINITY_DN647_c0_g1_i3.p1 TRINITY_DN647_c0_g1~~TRINITY_DN647_c0_g1_i3.p1  ORF type:complete len:227 (+),score=48.39 TRINITY_DN647_c0_g1_i3:489-1169(+)
MSKENFIEFDKETITLKPSPEIINAFINCVGNCFQKIGTDSTEQICLKLFDIYRPVNALNTDNQVDNSRIKQKKTKVQKATSDSDFESIKNKYEAKLLQAEDKHAKRKWKKESPGLTHHDDGDQYHIYIKGGEIDRIIEIKREEGPGLKISDEEFTIQEAKLQEKHDKLEGDYKKKFAKKSVKGIKKASRIKEVQNWLNATSNSISRYAGCTAVFYSCDSKHLAWK